MIPLSTKPIQMEPLSGMFDHRSPPDAVPFGVWRYLQNMEMTSRRRLRRAPGWEKLLTKVGYNNEDFHDQLTGLSVGSERQPITLIHQLTSPAGLSRLLIGTSKRLAILNNSTGNWHIISDILGNSLGEQCEDQGWRVAQSDYTVVFTNGSDEPVYYVLDQPPLEDLDQSVSKIPDLAKIGLSQAKTVASFKGIVIFGNVIMDGERIAHRLVWSDASRPLSWMPRLGESAAGFQDLGYGEDIMEMMPMGDSLLVYTATGIWEGLLVGGDTPLVFRKRYADHTAGNRCLAYRRTLITTGSDHYYLGRDGIYRYNFYTDRPIREEWMHVGSSVIFQNISKSCHIHVGGYNAKEKSIYFSWGREGDLCPTQTMVLNTEYESDYVLDHGFSAFANYNPDTYTTIMDWIIENCICTSSEMGTAEGIVEGAPVEITWTNVVGATNVGNTLTKTASVAWDNAGAFSNQSIPTGDGYVQFSPAQIDKGLMVGLGDSTDTDQHYSDLTYAFYTAGNAQLHIYESGVFVGIFGSYLTTDVLRIEIISGLALYKQNGVTLYTSAVPATYPLHVDVSILDTDAVVGGVKIYDESMERLVGGFGPVKDGGFCVTPVVDVDCEPIQYLYTDVLRTMDDIQVEDWDQPTAHPNSLCARLGTATMSQLCAGELDQDECNAEQLFVAASTTDFALKQIGTAYSRERVTDTSPCGLYTYDGYTTIARSGPLDMKAPSMDKLLRHLLIDLQAEDEAVPNFLKMRVGAAYSPADPNDDKCSLRWFPQTSKKLECPSVTGEIHKQRNTRQSNKPGIEWPLYIQDRYLFVEFSIEGTGGASSFSKLVFWVETKKL